MERTRYLQDRWRTCLLAPLVVAGLIGLLAGCGGRRGMTIDAADLPQPGAGAAAEEAPGQERGGGAAAAEQGEVAARPLDEGPAAPGPGGGAPGDGGLGQAPGQGERLALGPAVDTPAGRVHEVEALRDVYFEFDSYALGDAAKETLAYNSEWMRRYSTTKVLIEGHTDERGSVAYNLALGERRAVAARDYLVSLGIAQQRLSTISYGEERPADPGHSEEAWAKNRRVHFVVIGQ